MSLLDLVTECLSVEKETVMSSFMEITEVSWRVFLLLQLTLRHHWQGFVSYWCREIIKVLQYLLSK